MTLSVKDLPDYAWLSLGGGSEVARRISQAARGRPSEGLDQLLANQDLTILDLGAGIGKDVLDLARACQLVWLVVTPEPTSLADAYAISKRLLGTRFLASYRTHRQSRRRS